MALSTNTSMFQINPEKGFSTNPPKSVNSYLITSTATDINVSDLVDAGGGNNIPNYLNFTADGDFWVLWNGTGATVPSANIINGTSPELNPGLRYIAGISSFSIVSTTGVKVSISMYY